MTEHQRQERLEKPKFILDLAYLTTPQGTYDLNRLLTDTLMFLRHGVMSDAFNMYQDSSGNTFQIIDAIAKRLLDPPINEKTTRELIEQGIKEGLYAGDFTHIFCSDAKRARETALICRELLGRTKDIEIILTPSLGEVIFGISEARIEELFKKHGMDAIRILLAIAMASDNENSEDFNFAISRLEAFNDLLAEHYWTCKRNGENFRPLMLTHSFNMRIIKMLLRGVEITAENFYNTHDDSHVRGFGIPYSLWDQRLQQVGIVSMETWMHSRRSGKDPFEVFPRRKVPLSLVEAPLIVDHELAALLTNPSSLPFSDASIENPKAREKIDFLVKEIPRIFSSESETMRASRIYRLGRGKELKTDDEISLYSISRDEFQVVCQAVVTGYQSADHETLKTVASQLFEALYFKDVDHVEKRAFNRLIDLSVALAPLIIADIEELGAWSPQIPQLILRYIQNGRGRNFAQLTEFVNARILFLEQLSEIISNKTSPPQAWTEIQKDIADLRVKLLRSRDPAFPLARGWADFLSFRRLDSE